PAPASSREKMRRPDLTLPDVTGSSLRSGRNEDDARLRGISIEDHERPAGWISQTENGIPGQPVEYGNAAFAGKRLRRPSRPIELDQGSLGIGGKCARAVERERHRKRLEHPIAVSGYLLNRHVLRRARNQRDVTAGHDRIVAARPESHGRDRTFNGQRTDD